MDKPVTNYGSLCAMPALPMPKFTVTPLVQVCLLFVDWTPLHPSFPWCHLFKLTPSSSTECPYTQVSCDAIHLGLPHLHWLNTPTPKFPMMPFIWACLIFIDQTPLHPSFLWHHPFELASSLSTKCPYTQVSRDTIHSSLPPLRWPNAPTPKFPMKPFIWVYPLFVNWIPLHPSFPWCHSFELASSLLTECSFLLCSHMPFHMSGNDTTTFFNTYTDIVSVLVLKYHWNVNIICQNVIFNIPDGSEYFIVFFHTMHTHYPRLLWWWHVLFDLPCILDLLCVLHFYCMNLNLSICRADETLCLIWCWVIPH